MKTHTFCLFFLLFFTLFTIAAPSAFAPMSFRPEPIVRGRQHFQPRENTTPALLLVVDGRTTALPEPARADGSAEELRLVGTPGDYFSGKFALYAFDDLSEVKWNCSSLASDADAIIPGSSLRLTEVVPPSVNRYDEAPGAALLTDDFTTDFRRGDGALLQLFIEIPADTPAGLYRGKVTLHAGANHWQLPVALRVMPFALPDLAQHAGFYLPGHFYGESVGIQECFATPDWQESRLDDYMRFLKSRRLDSIALYHNYPELRYVNGKAIADFSTFSRFARAMKEADLQGPMVIEVRHIMYWCHAVATRLKQSAQPPLPDEDLGVKGSEAWAVDAFDPQALELFRDVMVQLLATAKSEGWPELLIAPEEEMSNTPRKAAGYDAFMPILLELCPENALVIDNELGYNRKNEIDRGHRDNVRNRQYNNWPESALAQARADGSRIMSFNYDAERLSFGFEQYRLGSELNHQWADFWRFSPTSWQYTQLTPSGVVSSVEIEQIHQGRLDLAACMLLEARIDALNAAGHETLATTLSQLLAATVADLPTNGYVYRNWLKNVSDDNAQRRFWKLLLAINQADHHLTGSPLVQPQPTTGSPSLHLRPLSNQTAATASADNTRQVKLAPASHQADARIDGETFWSESTGALIYLGEQEKALRAIWTREEEFARMAPSYSAAWFSYAPEGLMIYAEANHQVPGGEFRWERPTDDPDLWQDDVLEFFFRLPEYPEVNFQLIVNSRGSRAFNRNLQNIPAAEISVEIRTPINASGGTAWELLIPWRYFQLDRAPQAGTLWACNVGREFPTYHQILSWVPVESSFHETAQWGALLFAGEQDRRGFADLQIGDLYCGRNHLSGTIQANTMAQQLRVIDAATSTVQEIAVRSGERFALDLAIPRQAAGAVWQLQLLDVEGALLDSIRLPIQQSGKTVTAREKRAEALVGESATLQLDIRYPQTAAPSRLHAEFRDADDAPVATASCQLDAPGKYLLDFTTSGLPTGDGELRLWVGQEENAQSAFAIPLTLYPAFY